MSSRDYFHQVDSIRTLPCTWQVMTPELRTPATLRWELIPRFVSTFALSSVSFIVLVLIVLLNLSVLGARELKRIVICVFFVWVCLTMKSLMKFVAFSCQNRGNSPYQNCFENETISTCPCNSFTARGCDVCSSQPGCEWCCQNNCTFLLFEKSK